MSSTAGPSPAPQVHYEARDGVAVLTLDAPPANCYSLPLMKSLDEAVLRARFDDEVEVIVLTGRGERFFCAGADISMLASVTPSFKYYFCLHANETLSRLEQTPKLCVAAINGHCVGGGLEIALACDLRIARAGDFQIGLPEVQLGVLPGTGGTQRLTRLVGKARAIELMIEAEKLDPAQALASGLVNKVWEAPSQEEFVKKVKEYAHGFCPPAGPAMAVGRIKRAVQSGGEMALEQGLAFERELQAELFASSDAKEGLAAYTSKKKPVFRAR
jgi:enoyl-CoA hydratase/carnithine racemase